jgi:phage terminase large subunit
LTAREERAKALAPAPPPPPDPNAFVDWVRMYRDNPVLFAKEVLGVDLDVWQADVMMAVARGERRISIRSGHGVGKSTTVAIACIWYLLTRYPVKIVITAPTSAQLFDALFAEIKRWVNQLPDQLQELLNVKSDRIEIKAAPETGFISARTSRAESPEALQGIHADNVLLIADEASGVPEAVFEAAAGSMSGEEASTILLGNPTRSSGFFFDTHNRLKDQWWTRRVSCVDSPRVSKAYVEEMKQRYGEDSNAYRVRVLGEFPLSDDDTVIPMHLIDAAMHRDLVEDDKAPAIWALDVARFGTDRSALAKRRGQVISEVKRWAGLDLMQLTGAVVAEYQAQPTHLRPMEILVDSIGLGSGVVDRLRELKLPARGINVSESPSMKGTYVNLRAELWFATKAWLEQRGCKLPKDEDLMAELAGPRFRFSSSGKMQIEGKDEMRKRGLRSPDLADAVCLTMAADAATALYGTSSNGNWNRPLKRGLKGVA